MTLRFDGKVAVVTGAGNGLGRAYALLLGSRGAKVVVNDLGGSFKGDGKSTRAADKVVEEIQKAGGEAVANYDSVTDGDKVIQTALDTYGSIDILVNNAGILRDVSFKKMTDQDFKLVHDVHMWGTYKTTKAAWATMQKNKYGRIVNVASAAGIYGNFGQANYSSAKLGILSFTKTIAHEGASKNIIANCVAPFAASRMTETIMPQELLEMMGPEYVAPIVGYLCHESVEGTGQLIELGGGWVSALRWQRTAGKTLPPGDFTPEAVQKLWGDITDFEGEVTYPTSPNDAMESIVANLEAYKKAKL
eukprot:maker-scaffold_1-snap-gene-21.52-mRNA-1 protein AED:0.01 eAED:0.01 QI:389/1/1/1/1/1/2/338/304